MRKWFSQDFLLFTKFIPFEQKNLDLLGEYTIRIHRINIFPLPDTFPSAERERISTKFNYSLTNGKASLSTDNKLTQRMHRFALTHSV